MIPIPNGRLSIPQGPRDRAGTVQLFAAGSETVRSVGFLSFMIIDTALPTLITFELRESSRLRPLVAGATSSLVPNGLRYAIGDDADPVEPTCDRVDDLLLRLVTVVDVEVDVEMRVVEC